MVAQKYPENSIRLYYFLSVCELLSEQEKFVHDIALKFRPYGDLMGIDDLSLDHQPKNFENLCLHAIFITLVDLYTRSLNKDLVTPICSPGNATTVFSAICRDFCFAYV